MKRAHFAAVLSAATTLSAALTATAAPSFTYAPPGSLLPGSGKGRVDYTIYAPGMRFPIESGPAYANSQVYMAGGGKIGGSHCDSGNFTYPWRDNFCESRSWYMPLCPSGTGHQGQDIRAATCKKNVHWVVAVADGTITTIGSYITYMTADNGTRYDYLHMGNLQVKVGDRVTRGQRIGMVSNQFGTSQTTVHLHFNIMQNVAGIGSVFVPPYLSLVDSYKDLLGLNPPKPDAGVKDASAPPPVDASAPPAADAAPPTTADASLPLPPPDAGPSAEGGSSYPLAIDPFMTADAPSADAEEAPQESAGCATASRGATVPTTAALAGIAALVVTGLVRRRRKSAR